jgi:predicted PurR-regulated permease PerM
MQLREVPRKAPEPRQPGAEWSRLEIAAQILAVLGLVAVLELRLLSALIFGLLIFELVNLVAPGLERIGVTHKAGKAVALTLLSIVIIAALSLAVTGLVSLFTGQSDSLVLLLEKMAEEVDTVITHLPPWAAGYLPANAGEIEAAAADWLRQHAGQLQMIGQDVGRMLAHSLFGMIIGGMIALTSELTTPDPKPFARALALRAWHLGIAFRRVVFAQVRISALNTTLTAIYLLVILPAMGIQMPLAKTMVAVTFVVGLLPVLGNLISNTIIVVISLSVSSLAAIGSLIFLVAIHKLEYFANAKIIGSRIHARAWELLLAMLVMDAAFGIPGVIAAPIYYAYLKDELAARGLI